MGKTTGISWTDATWNPWQGCTKVSQGCKNCYMFRDKKRYGQDPNTVVRSKPATFNAPLKWDLPERSRIFVCSWSDFFHEDADAWRDEAYQIIYKLPQYDFLIPTKRIERFEKCLPYFTDPDPIKFPDNVWLGVSVENQKMADKRIPILAKIPASVRWISAEPLLEPINILGNLLDGWHKACPKINWVVVGGESGSGCRTMNTEWARYLVNDCKAAGTPVFVKQLGGWPDTRSKLEDLPEDLRIREFPKE